VTTPAIKGAVADSHRALLYTLFGLFETLIIACVVLAFCVDSREQLAFEDAVGLAFWFAFVGQLIVCFILRRAARRLAIIGWLTLFAAFWCLALVPVT